MGIKIFITIKIEKVLSKVKNKLIFIYFEMLKLFLVKDILNNI